MTYRKTMLSASIVAALMFTGVAMAHTSQPNKHQQPAQPQNTTQQNQSNTQNQTREQREKAAQQNAQNLKGIVVVGIRTSLEKSLQTKRNADAIVSAITAEGISQFPNNNAAEALSLLPGIQVDQQFGQGQRISIDGTPYTLNLTLLDNHPVAQTVWRYFSQPQRGFNYLMISPDIIGRAEVFKSQQAKLISGSLGGTVIMHTREPLDMKANTISGYIGGNYNDLSKKTDPSASLFYSWKNQDNTFGFDVGLDYYKEKIDRQGLEVFGWSPLSTFTDAGNTAAINGVKNGKFLLGDMSPQEVNSAWFQQWIKRKSAVANIQFRPNDNFSANLGLLYIKEEFTNFNQSVYNFMTHGTIGPKVETSFNRNANGLITGGTANPGPFLTSADTNENVFFDPLARVSNITTKGAHLKLKYQNSSWALGGQIGTNKANNPNNRQYGPEFAYNGPYSWNLYTGVDPYSHANWKNPSMWAANGAPSVNIFASDQKDTFGQLNFQKFFDNSFINTVALGVRYAKSETNFGGRQIGRLLPAGDNMTAYGSTQLANVNGSLPQVAFGARYYPYVTLDQIIAFSNSLPPTASIGPLGNNPSFVSTYSYGFAQKTNAAYLQFDYDSGPLRGNFGVRYVHTKNLGSGFQVPGGATVTFANLDSFRVSQNGKNHELLPSFTVIYDAGNNVVLRGSMAKVMAWAPPNAMSFSNALNDTTMTGTIGNPGLGPYISYNTDVSAEWYFKPQAVLALSGFYKNITNYISQQQVVAVLQNQLSVTAPQSYAPLIGTHGCTSAGFCDYNVHQYAGGLSGRVKGLTLAYQQAFPNGFGLTANATYITDRTSLGQPLAFVSKWSGSVSPYYEKGPLTIRMNYNARSPYQGLGYVAGAINPTTGAFSTVSASIAWKFNKHLSLSLDGSNLTDHMYKQYQITDGRKMLLNRYYFGRRVSARLHFNF